jgi:hypothetical protein
MNPSPNRASGELASSSPSTSPTKATSAARRAKGGALASRAQFNKQRAAAAESGCARVRSEHLAAHPVARAPVLDARPVGGPEDTRGVSKRGETVDFDRAVPNREFRSSRPIVIIIGISFFVVVRRFFGRVGFEARRVPTRRFVAARPGHVAARSYVRVIAFSARGRARGEQVVGRGGIGEHELLRSIGRSRRDR